MEPIAKAGIVMEAADYSLFLAVSVMMALQDPKSDPGIHHRTIVHGSDRRRRGRIPMTREAVPR
jgi:hypothetical protein